MDTWRGTVSVGEYSMTATVHYQGPGPGIGEWGVWSGLGTAGDAWPLERLVADKGARLETNIGTIIITRISTDGSVEFQGSGVPKGPLACAMGIAE